MHRILLSFIALLLFPIVAFTQVTGATIEGTVYSTNGESLPGASVVAIHQPTGTKYGTATRDNGSYTLTGVHVGGPYIIEVTFVGFNPVKKELTRIKLGGTVEIDFKLEPGDLQIDQVVVTADVNPIFDNAHIGASTNISSEEISRIPTVTRSLSNYTRLSPLSTGGFSFGGANSRYNSLLVDGATLNDVFGLGTLPGTGADIGSPISIDAIEEFNVATAPFDVTNNGFTGAQINAITKSGTNEFHGSAYYFTRNQNFVGRYELERGNDTLSDRLENFQETFYGITLGGPIVKDKLFFFSSVELKREASPITTGIQGSGAPEVIDFPLSKFDSIKNIAIEKYGYDPGSIESPITTRRDNVKVLAKINWNINAQNKLMVRYNYVHGIDESGIGRGRNSYSFSNRQYNFNSTQNSIVAELTSHLNNQLFNTARVVYTRLRDKRDVVDEPFSQVSISLPFEDEGNGSILLGIDRFSQANSLGQDIIEITDNLTYILGNHEFTFGTSNQIYTFNNLFIQDAWGTYEFRSIQDFIEGDPYKYQFSYLLPGGNRRAKFSAFQLGLYAQDRWTVDEKLTLMLGIRADVPIIPETPTENPKVSAAFPGYSTAQVASGNFLISPRFGFHWDIGDGDMATQLRGGFGIFSGAPPFVWISNQYSNTGADFGRLDIRGEDAFEDGFFSADPYDQPSPATDPSLETINTTAVNLIDTDFKYPQDLKVNLAFDRELPLGFSFSLEGVYSKSLNAVTFTNLNFVKQGESKYGRPLYGDVSLSSFGNADGNPVRQSSDFTRVILMQNSNLGHRYLITAQLQKQFYSGFYVNLAYTYNRAFDVNGGSSSRAVSNWQYNETVDVNHSELGTSDWERRHRILANVSYSKDYFNGFNTTVSLIYSGFTGTPFSWIYNGNANADTRYDNDLVYVPNTSDDIVLVSDNWNAMDAFINSNNSLDEYRGDFVPRNSAREPWTNYLDFKLSQGIPTINGQSLELSVSIFNVLNLLNSEWGKRQSVSFNNYRVWTLKQYVNPEFIGNNPDLNLNSGDLGKPVVSFDPGHVMPAEIYEDSTIGSRWQLQIGLKYKF